VKDYTCTFSKQERMDGRLGARQLIDVRFREDPFSVAMTWRENPPRGDRVLYVEGRWEGKMLVRPTGVLARAIVPVAVRDPDGKEAMAETRRPVTMFGFKRSLQSLLDVYREAKKQGRLKESSGGFVEVKGRTAVVLVRELRPRKGETDSGSAPEHPPLTRIYIDTESLVPIMIEGYTAADAKKLSSRYLYEDVKFNVGLTDADFTPQSLDMPEPQVQPAR
jgi:hypothetical protein